MVIKAHPWSAYALRVLCSTLMFATAYTLLSGSTFALRMRGDLPVPAIVVIMSAVLSFGPLLLGRKFLGALLVSSFLIAGIGGYWWTTIPWDEFIKDSGFPTPQSPGFWDYALIASPPIVAAFYGVVSRPSVLRADLKKRGADIDEIHAAASVSFLSGAALLVFCTALSAALWAIMAAGIAFAAVAPIPTGIPALVLVALLVTIAWALLSPSRFPLVRRARRASGGAPIPASDRPARTTLGDRLTRRSRRKTPF